MIRHPVGSPVSRQPHPVNQFRQPFLPPHARVPMHSHNPGTLNQPLRPNEFRMQNSLIQGQSSTQVFTIHFTLTLTISQYKFGAFLTNEF